MKVEAPLPQNGLKRLARSILGIHRRISKAYGPANATATSSETVSSRVAVSNSRIHLEETKRLREMETQKALMASLSRHETWKAGGPV